LSSIFGLKPRKEGKKKTHDPSSSFALLKRSGARGEGRERKKKGVNTLRLLPADLRVPVGERKGERGEKGEGEGEGASTSSIYSICKVKGGKKGRIRKRPPPPCQFLTPFFTYYIPSSA